jgi:flagellar hook-associated protein 3 FlgL
MRTTAASFPTVLRYQLTNLSTRQARLQTQAGTGQRFQVASEDPRAMRKVLDLQGEIKSLGQYERNIGTLKDTIDASYAAMSSLKKVSDRATEIATRSDGLRTDEELRTFATEIDQLIERGLQLGNSRHQGNYLFGGTKNTQAAFTETRDASGRVTSVTYNGTNSVSEGEIATGISVSVAIPGENTSGAGTRALFKDTRADAQADIFGHLIALRDNLLAGDSQTVRTSDLPNLLKDEENILFHFGNVGAIQTRLETAADLSVRRSTSLEGLVSREADADLAETLVALSEIQNAYQAALKTGGTILNQSLLDYIR